MQVHPPPREVATAENAPSPSKHPPEVVDSSYKPPERSTSAPPVLLTSDALFAFRAEEYAKLFTTDIRCEENYLDFYHSQGGEKSKLPPPLEAQPFLYDTKSFDEIKQEYSRSSYLSNYQQPPDPSSRIPAFPFYEERTFPPGYLPAVPHHSSQQPIGSGFGMQNPFANPRRFSASIVEGTNDEAKDTDTGSPLLHVSSLAGSPMWSPLPRKMASLVLDDNFELDQSSDNKKSSLTNSLPASMSASESDGNISWRGDPRLPQVEESVPRPFNPSASAPSGTAIFSGAAPPQRNATPPSPTICRYFVQGYCSRGDRCKFLHQHPTISSTSRPSPQKSPPIPQGQTSQPKQPTPAVGATNQQIPPQSTSPNTVMGISEGLLGETSWESSQPRRWSADELNSLFPSIDQLTGQIFSMCRDQHGCRYLQRKLDENDPHAVELIFTEVVDHASQLMADPFGNYLCQKLLENCNDWQRYRLIESISRNLVSIAVNMHGTRAVQKLIEHLDKPDEIKLVKDALRKSVVMLIQDLNGNHVIQRCLHQLSPADNQFIYDAVTEDKHVVDVATHRHGCCVLQRCIDYASPEQKMQLVKEIMCSALSLVQDPFGNYVVQYVLELPFDGLSRELVYHLKGHFVELAMQKFSSNVIEKLVQQSDRTARTQVVSEIIESGAILQLLQDPYANYVVQTALSFADTPQHKQLVDTISPHLAVLRNTPYGKRIQSKVLKETSSPESSYGGSPKRGPHQHSKRF